MQNPDQIRDQVRTHYSAIARGGAGCCVADDRAAASARLGYSTEELAAVPPTANLALGCGNPQAIAALTPGQTVLDLGCGGGFDAFLAARAVGPSGRVIGVDMSADMISLARANASKHGATNVEFLLGEIEHLPVASASVDVVISNCVINLVPDKRAAYAEILRVLRPGGRIAISDVVALAPMPATVAEDVAARCGCVAGAAHHEEVAALLRDLGFGDVRVDVDPASREVIESWAPGSGFSDLVSSAQISATRAVAPACCAPGCCG